MEVGNNKMHAVEQIIRRWAFNKKASIAQCTVVQNGVDWFVNRPRQKTELVIASIGRNYFDKIGEAVRPFECRIGCGI
jgi:hypothetical protein